MKYKVLRDVLDERARQETLFPDQHLPNGTTGRLRAHSDAIRRMVDTAAERNKLTWRDVLTEEFYEALAEEDPEKLRKELTQVAAVAIRWIEDIDGGS